MIYVIRHGQTDLNKEGRLQGRQGLPLNENGVEGIPEDGNILKFSSDNGQCKVYKFQEN